MATALNLCASCGKKRFPTDRTNSTDLFGYFYILTDQADYADFKNLMNTI